MMVRRTARIAGCLRVVRWGANRQLQRDSTADRVSSSLSRACRERSELRLEIIDDSM